MKLSLSRPTPTRALAGFSFLAPLCLTYGAAAAQTEPPGAQTLPPVVVTATRFPEEASQLPFGVSVITAQQIRDAGAATVNEALMKLLGLQGRADFYGGGDFALDLRGFGATADSNMAIVVDGVRVSEGDTGGTRLAGIPIDSVQRIEVVRSSVGVLYGEGTTAGAIVITTKAAGGAQARSGASFYGGMGSFGLGEARANATIAAGDITLDVAGSRRTADGYRDNFRSQVEGVTSTLQWRNQWLRIGARSAQDELHTELPGALTAAEYRENPAQTTHTGERADIKNHRSGVFAEASLGEWQLSGDAGMRDKSLFALNPITYAYDVDARNQSLRLKHAMPMRGAANAFVIGADRSTWTRVVQGAFGSTAEQESKAIYAKDDLTLPTGTRLSAGIRSEHADKRDSASARALNERHTAWDVGVLHPITTGLSLYARLGESFRFANADEFSFAITPLKPQTSRDIDVGARWQWHSGRAELRYYRNALRNEIGFDPNAGLFGDNVNFDSTRREGVEIDFQEQLNAEFKLRLNAAYREALFTSGSNNSQRIPLSARYTAAAGVDWRAGSGHTLSGSMNVVSSAPPDFANACAMPFYATADLRYAYQNQGVELAFAVANAGDRKYYTQAFGCTAVSSETTAIYPSSGRAYLVSVRVAF